MTIPPITLGDLTWTDLTDAARRRIPAASKGRWTLHAPVDPGVTLLELHAWLLEQRLYWMDHIPDSLTRGALALLGERPLDAQYATTAMQLTASALASVPADTALALVHSDPPLVFTTDDDTLVLPFERETRNGVDGPPLVGVVIAGKDRMTDLRYGRSVCLFEGGGEVELVLRLKQTIPAATAGEIAILFLLDGDAVAPQWSADAADAPPPATLAWRYPSAPGGTLKRFAQVRDGTGGLRRSGIVRLALPADLLLSPPDPKGILSFSIHIGVDSGSFTAPPRLSGVWPNAVTARHRRLERESRDADWLPLCNAKLALTSDQVPPLVERTALSIRESDDQWHDWQPTADLAFHGREDRVFVVDSDAGMLIFGNGETGRVPVLGWGFSAGDLADPLALAAAWASGATDPVSAFLAARLSAEDAAVVSSATTVRDALVRVLCSDLNGVLDEPKLHKNIAFASVVLRDETRALLASDRTPHATRRLNRLLLEDAYPNLITRGGVRLSIDVGGGSAGNVGARCAWEPYGGPVASGLSAINVVAATGGAAREPLDDARQRAASDLRRVERAVLAADYEYLACTTPGVAIKRAHAAIGLNGDFPCMAVPGAVTVLVVPDATRDATACATVPAPLPDAGALSAVSARLDAARLLGTELHVRAPIYRDVAVSVDVQADTNSPGAIRADIAAWLTRFLDPLVGGEEETGWPFGDALTPSVLLRGAQDAIGNRGEVVGIGIRLLDGDAAEERCNDVAIGANALPVLRQVVTRVAANPSPVGGLL